MKRWIIFLNCISIIFTTNSLYPAREENKVICITEEDHKEIVTTLNSVMKIIADCDHRMKLLRSEIPVIEYKVTEDGIVIQKIQINVLGDNPLIYKNVVSIESVNSVPVWFPFRLLLVGGVEIYNRTDIKLGCQLVSLAPLQHKYLRYVSFNILIGFRSSAFSVSYQLSKPWNNVTLHFYSGLAYSLDIQKIFGLGIGLYF